MARLYGVISRLVSQDAETGRSIMLFDYENLGSLINGKIFAIAKAAQVGDAFVADGDWISQTYKGRVEEVFRAHRYRPDTPRTPIMTKRWLTRLLCDDRHGLSGALIERALAHWGDRLMKEHWLLAARLASLTSASDRFLPLITSTLQGRLAGRLALSLLEESGLDDPLIGQILAGLPENAHKLIVENPYCTARIPDVGFVNADKIGRKIGIEPHDRRRLLAALEEIVRTLAQQGSTSVDLDTLLARTQGLVGITVDQLVEFLRREANAMDHGLVIVETQGRVFCSLRELFAAEMSATLGAIRLLTDGRRNDQKSIAQGANELFKKRGFSHFDPLQRVAVEMASIEPISIITGGPGTGKSAIMKAVVALADRWDRVVFLAAPTGGAARRLSEASGRKAQTVHRLLKAREDINHGRTTFAINRQNPLPSGCFVIVDEASMNDIELMAALMEAMPMDGRLLLVGDQNQLPSVGPGAVLRDFLNLRVGPQVEVPSVQLKKIYRQGPDSGIVIGAAKIAEGVLPALSDRNVNGVVFKSVSADAIGPFVEDLVCKTLPLHGFKPISDIATLCPQAPGPGGTHDLNRRLSERLNPNGASLPGVFRSATDRPDMPIPRLGDKVMVTWNDPQIGVANGDIGFIVGSGASPTGRPTIRIRLESGEEFEHPAARWRDLLLAYAATIHKSQGSQYPAVIMPILSSHSKMLERRLLFTGWTRAQHQLVLVGEIEALRQAIANKGEERQTLVQSIAEAKTRMLTFTPPINWSLIVDAALVEMLSRDESESAQFDVPDPPLGKFPVFLTPLPPPPGRSQVQIKTGLSVPPRAPKFHAAPPPPPTLRTFQPVPLRQVPTEDIAEKEFNEAPGLTAKQKSAGRVGLLPPPPPMMPFKV